MLSERQDIKERQGSHSFLHFFWDIYKNLGEFCQDLFFCEFLQENPCLQPALLPLAAIIIVSDHVIPLMSSEFSFSILLIYFDIFLPLFSLEYSLLKKWSLLYGQLFFFIGNVLVFFIVGS